jgi:hypothetical protein
LGQSIFAWSIPAIRTCPGKSSICSELCYATKNRYARGFVQKRLQWCYEQSQRRDFVERMQGEIYRRGVLVLRVHVAGDMATPAYARKWIEIATRCASTRFFCYSRSWRVEEIKPLLFTFGALPNVRLWLSADAATSIPPEIPEGVRVAWLQRDQSLPPASDLVFRIQRLRKLPAPAGIPVCAHETPEGKAKGVNCSNCGVCWR